MENDMARKIKLLRLERNMTLEQVANIVGVGKSTVRKWETGMIANMGRDKIGLLAKALGTTPAFLMGWNEDTPADKKEEARSEGERLVLELYRRVSESRKKLVIQMLQVDLEQEE